MLVSLVVFFPATDLSTAGGNACMPPAVSFGGVFLFDYLSLFMSFLVSLVGVVSPLILIYCFIVLFNWCWTIFRF